MQDVGHTWTESVVGCVYDYTARVLRILKRVSDMLHEVEGMSRRMMYEQRVRIIDPNDGTDYAEILGQYVGDWLTEHTSTSDQPADRGILKELAEEIRREHEYLSGYIVEVYETSRLYKYVEDERGWLDLIPAV